MLVLSPADVAVDRWAHCQIRGESYNLHVVTEGARARQARYQKAVSNGLRLAPDLSRGDTIYEGTFALSQQSFFA